MSHATLPRPGYLPDAECPALRPSTAPPASFERAIVGWFERAARQFRRIPVEEQCEVLSLIGDVAESQDGPVPHAA